jgi:hypothetical protein
METLALETETAISILNITEKKYYIHAVAKNIKQIKEKKYVENRKNKQELKLITDLGNKLIANKLIVTKADKWKTLVIHSQEEQKQKNK